MAVTVASNEPLKMEDVAGVRSRISWPAIVAGAVVAVATNLVLTLFFAALGLTIAEAGVRAGAVGTAALIAALVSIVLSLFVGGWVSTQLTAGENEREAVLYGILTWALVVGFSLAIVGMGARAGYFAIVGGSMIGQQNPTIQQRLDAGLTTVEQKAAQTQEELKNDAAAQQRIEQAQKAAVGASWAALVGIMLSMAASIIGAMVGCGTAFRLIPVARPRVASQPTHAIIIP
jgi:hypothetical protein